MRTKITSAELKEAGITRNQLNDWAEGVAEIGREAQRQEEEKRAGLPTVEQITALGFRDAVEYTEGADWFPAGDPDFNRNIYIKAQLFGRRIDVVVEKATGDVYLDGNKSTLKVTVRF